MYIQGIRDADGSMHRRAGFFPIFIADIGAEPDADLGGDLQLRFSRMFSCQFDLDVLLFLHDFHLP